MHTNEEGAKKAHQIKQAPWNQKPKSDTSGVKTRPRQKQKQKTNDGNYTEILEEALKCKCTKS